MGHRMTSRSRAQLADNTSSPLSLFPRWGRITVIIMGTGAVIVAMLAWLLLQMPMDIPDASSPPISNNFGPINDSLAVGQTFAVERDGLFRISVVMAAQESSGDAEVTFTLRETPEGEPLRTVKRRVADLPSGKVAIYSPGTITERWHSFEFEPVPDSAGRRFYFSLDGMGVPIENGVGALMFFHNRYQEGQAYQNGKPLNAHVVFRAYSRGQVSDLLGVIGRNLTAEKPGPLSVPLPYLVLAALYAVLAGTTIKTAIGRSSAPD